MSALREVAASWSPGEVRCERVVTEEQVSAFARLLDEPDPSGSGLVPPLWHWFAFTPRLASADLGDDGHPRQGPFVPPVPDRRRMLGGGSLELARPWRIGRPVTRTSAVADVAVKEGSSGEMMIVRTRHELADADGIIAVEHEDALYRSQAPGAERRLRQDEVGDGDAAAPTPGEVALPTGTPLLFGFSALTTNAHRIHYDAPYARDVEGYRDLVVHGPLLALMMLEPYRRAGVEVASFDFRFRRPMFVGDRIEARPPLDSAGVPTSGRCRVVSGRTSGTCAESDVVVIG